MDNDLILEVVPGILEKEWEAIEKKIEQVLPFTRTIHIDLLDGKFADNHTYTFPKPFEKYKDRVTLEVHMMVDNPIQYLEAYAAAGFTRFLGHIEKMPSQEDFVAKAEQLGEVGLALDKESRVEDINVSLQDLDALLVMSIKAGFSGQTFDPHLLDKVKKIREREAFLPIEVDGGINGHTILEAKAAGATRFVTTSYLFGSENPKEQFDKLSDLLSE